MLCTTTCRAAALDRRYGTRKNENAIRGCEAILLRGRVAVGTPFLSEIKIISWNYAPKGWALCNVQLLPINQNQALFSLVGTQYGGDGRTTFGLPDMRGRAPIHTSSGSPGTKDGIPAVTVSITQMPTHNHIAMASTTNGDQPSP